MLSFKFGSLLELSSQNFPANNFRKILTVTTVSTVKKERIDSTIISVFTIRQSLSSLIFVVSVNNSVKSRAVNQLLK